MPNPKKVLLLCLVLLGGLALLGPIATSSSTPLDDSAEAFSEPIIVEATIAPHDSHEVCLDLSPTETLRYRYETSGQSYFNVHYHDEAEEALYPVPDRLRARETASFSPDVEAHYCLMWTNANNEGLELALSYRTE